MSELQGLPEGALEAMGVDERAPSGATHVPSKALRTVSAHDGGCFTCAFDRCKLLKIVQHKLNTFLCHLLCNVCGFKFSLGRTPAAMLAHSRQPWREHVYILSMTTWLAHIWNYSMEFQVMAEESKGSNCLS